MDVRSARSAGALFRHGGKLYRPTQDCSRSYGYSFTLNEIVRLTPRDYEERPVRTVEPGNAASWTSTIVGTHTYARARSAEIVDGCTWVPCR